MMNVVTKFFLNVALFAIISFHFISCNDKNEEILKKDAASKEIKVPENTIPDGIWIGYYYLPGGNAIEVRDTYKNNRLVSRKINGAEVNLAEIPKQHPVSNQNDAIDVSLALAEQYPCVQVLVEYGFPNQESVMYIVEYDSEEPCWYEKYQ